MNVCICVVCVMEKLRKIMINNKLRELTPFKKHIKHVRFGMFDLFLL